MSVQENGTVTQEEVRHRSWHDDLMDSLASLDLINRFDAWFGHWWNVPFWKSDRPLVTFLENLTWSSYKRFAMPRDGGVSGYEAEVFLRNHGVNVWGRWFDIDNVYFNVKNDQAAWAEYLLMREGIATANTVVDERNEVWAAPYDKAPPGWGSNKRAFVDVVAGVVGLSRYRPRSRQWPAGKPKPVKRKPSRRRKRRKKQQTTLRRAVGAAATRMNTRRPVRPHRPGNHRQK